MKKLMLGLALSALSMGFVACDDSDDVGKLLDDVEKIGDTIAEMSGCNTGVAICKQTDAMKAKFDSSTTCAGQAEAVLKYSTENYEALDKAVTDYSAVGKWEDFSEGACSTYNGAKMAKCLGEFSMVYKNISDCEGLTEQQKSDLKNLEKWNESLEKAAKNQGLSSDSGSGE